MWDKGKLIAYIEYDKEGKELLRMDWTYNEQGREIGYKLYGRDQLKEENKNYLYEGNTLTYDRDITHMSYDIFMGTDKYRIIFYGADFDRKKLISSTRYKSDGKEWARYEYTYDEQGREIGSESYWGEKLNEKAKNYSYNENVLTYDEYRYDNDGNLENTYKCKTVFYDKKLNKSKIISNAYYAEGKEVPYEEFTYDEQGRETSFKSYIRGELYIEDRDYIYNGNELTGTRREYHSDNDSTFTEQKIKFIFYQKKQ